MFLTQKKYSRFELPVAVHLGSPNFQVKLHLLGITSNGATPIAFNAAPAYELKKLSSVAGGWMYAVVLNQNDFPRASTYYGVIQITDNDTQTTSKLTDVQIVIEEPELATPSKTQLFGKYLSYGELLDYVTGRNLSFAFPVTKNENGEQVVRILTDYKFPIVVRNDVDNGPLPLGSYIEVFDKKTGQQVPFSNGYNGGIMRAELAWTNPDGTIQGEGNPQRIADGEVSYTYISGLPKGKYYAKIHATGKTIDPIFFDFPNKNCI